MLPINLVISPVGTAADSVWRACLRIVGHDQQSPVVVQGFGATKEAAGADLALQLAVLAAQISAATDLAVAGK